MIIRRIKHHRQRPRRLEARVDAIEARIRREDEQARRMAVEFRERFPHRFKDGAR